MATDIKITEFTEEFEEDANRLNIKYRYNTLIAVQMGFRAPFLHVVAAFVTIFVWTLLPINLAIAVFISYSLAVILFLLITHILLATKLTHYGHVGEVFRMDRGMMWVALDVSRSPPLVVGMIGIKPLSSSQAEIVRYMVKDEYRGRGIGRGLLSTAIGFAKDTDYQEVQAEAWNVGVVDVLPIYERRGFSVHRSCYEPHSFLPMYRSYHFSKKLK
ncbi:N-acetyltransferase family 8 member 2 [Holothuria leucospilota]|uniref:N-acetyltransferase family 8 member 2 n=1 Tax=Holothuria leucospilota TaxID=206669 RepID=A0A9Q1CCS5_HOLLE|nr:N-acetyltransferase family 8 member 2 [Holothuria leucospilota]